MASSTNAIAEQQALSLYHLYDPEVLANPYPLYARLRSCNPVHWDPFLHAWIVTRYRDVVTVLENFSAHCAPAPERLGEMGLSSMDRIGNALVRQMLFMDPPDHGKLRAVCSVAFTPHRVERLRQHIQEITNRLLEPCWAAGRIELMADFADRLPAIVSAEILGVPPSDHVQLKAWSTDFAEILGNFQHNPDRSGRMLRSLDAMSSYFGQAIRERQKRPADDMISALTQAQLNGHRLSEEAIISNCILLMVGAQETTPNLIGNGMLTLLRNPDELRKLCCDLSHVPPAVEEMLRYEAPSQHTTRLAPYESELGGKRIGRGQSVIAIMGAANRDPERFPDPDRFDITRPNNKHLAFGAGGHFCFGAPLARLEGHLAFTTLLRRAREVALRTDDLVWRDNVGLRGLRELPLWITPV